ncbi:hypothetical protein QBC37DRAFT_370425 [Rhypophila decipiens]|uniref:Uncharacterized protein n=1 Tax=Rhypophila decipiens TaxID=261697 RepID=A0AAN6YE73_9PEZI|nr:hypothetical protein QBC37DRAFT_370425 [Rhypophila decipiens]
MRWIGLALLFTVFVHGTSLVIYRLWFSPIPGPKVHTGRQLATAPGSQPFIIPSARHDASHGRPDVLHFTHIAGPKLAAATGWYQASYTIAHSGHWCFEVKELQEEYELLPRATGSSDLAFWPWTTT